MHTGIQYDSHYTLTFPEYLSLLPVSMAFSRFLCSFMSSIVYLFVLFLVVIVVPTVSLLTTFYFPFRTFNIVLLRCVKIMRIKNDRNKDSDQIWLNLREI